MNFTLCDNTAKINDMFAAKLILLFVFFLASVLFHFVKVMRKTAMGVGSSEKKKGEYVIWSWASKRMNCHTPQGHLYIYNFFFWVHKKNNMTWYSSVFHWSTSQWLAGGDTLHYAWGWAKLNSSVVLECGVNGKSSFAVGFWALLWEPDSNELQFFAWVNKRLYTKNTVQSVQMEQSAICCICCSSEFSLMCRKFNASL